jgi:hypothetical protein
MITIQKQEYQFEVDVEKTKEYYQVHALCECDACKNFYAQIQGQFPVLEEFLTEFGVDVAKPDEAMSVDSEQSFDYIQVDYTVCGKIIAMGEYEIDLQDKQLLNIVVTDGFASPNEQTGEYFTLSVYNINLPWVLDKPFPEPIKIEPIKKMKRLFRKII